MIEIAQAREDEGVLQKDIATNQELSIKYLDHIISGLKKAGLIQNIRGKKSGYILTRPASEIRIYDIHVAFEGEICVIDCLQLGKKCDKESKCKPRKFWQGLNKVVFDYFQKTTLQDILDYE